MEDDSSLALCHPKAVLVAEDGSEIRRYEQSFHLMDDDPAVRFRRVLTEIGLVNQLVGVIRTDVLRSTLPLMNHTLAIACLWRSSVYMKDHGAAEVQYFRRFHQSLLAGTGNLNRTRSGDYSVGNAPHPARDLEVSLGSRSSIAP